MILLYIVEHNIRKHNTKLQNFDLHNLHKPEIFLSSYVPPLTAFTKSIFFDTLCLIPICNQFHNIWRLFDVLPIFPFTTSETMGDYYLQKWYIRGIWHMIYNCIASWAAERPRTKNPRILGNIRNVSKPHGTITQRPTPPAKIKNLPALAKEPQKTATKPLPPCATPHEN